MAEFVGSLLGEFLQGFLYSDTITRWRVIATLRACERKIRGRGLKSVRPGTRAKWLDRLRAGQCGVVDYNLRDYEARLLSCIEALA